MTGGVANARQKARQLYVARRQRDRALGGFASLMGEPVWDLLLHLFMTHDDLVEDAELGDEACDAVPPQASVHWIAVLQRLGLVERRPAGAGQRSSVRLSSAGVELVGRAITHA